MNVIKRCCLRSLKENRKRTVVTIIGVILATALITGVACLAESMRASLIDYARHTGGDYHYCFYDVSGEELKYFLNNTNIERLGISQEIGYAVLEGSQNPDKPYMYIRALDDESVNSMALELVSGRLPENDSELAVSRHIGYNGMVELHVGDTLTLQAGNRMSDGYMLNQSNPYIYEEESFKLVEEKVYTIVGIVERPNLGVEPRMAPGYSVFTHRSAGTAESVSAAERFEIYANYTGQGLRNADQVTAGLLNVPLELYQSYFRGTVNITAEEYAHFTQLSNVRENSELIRWQTLRFGSGTMRMLYLMASLAVFIIIVTSVFCIRNSFIISLTEKMKLYGRLASVGTTARQQRRMVYYEAVYLGAIGIPLGILSGLAATVILVRLVSGMVEEALDIPLSFGVSVPAILLAAVLSGVTIFLSAMKSARRAAKISPINAIRSNDSVKISRHEMKCPGLIDKIFGIGGRVAYRNLRRARRRYRTTVVSIVVSVAVFIGLTTFVQLLGKATRLYYNDIPYQLEVLLWNTSEDSYENAEKIARLQEVQQVEIQRCIYVGAKVSELPLTEEYRQRFLGGTVSEEDSTILHIYALGESGYRDYCESIGVDAEQARDKAIVLAEYKSFVRENDKIYTEEGRVAEFHRGDLINVDWENTDTGEVSESQLEVLVQTDKRPMSITGYNFNTVALIVSDQWLDSSPFSLRHGASIGVYIRCEDAGKVEKLIREELSLGRISLLNYEANYRAERSMYLVVAIFLYGFITVVALIGITNIFNTITTNLELRAPEFAMLRAVGMTGGEFSRMIWLEGVFYGGKALLIGIPIGLVISVAFHMAFSEEIVTSYQPPFLGIGLSAVAVALLLYGIMRYSMNKINRKNIVETIQNENL